MDEASCADVSGDLLGGATDHWVQYRLSGPSAADLFVET